MRRAKSLNLVAVHWIDATMSDDPDVRPMHGLAFGLIVGDEPEYLKVSGEVFEDGDARNVTAIPKSLVKGIYTVKLSGLPEQFRQWGPKEPKPAKKKKRK